MRRTAKTIAIVLAAVMIFTMFPLTASAASNKPGKVKIKSFKVSSVSSISNTATVTIKWKKAKKATGYWVYERQPDGSWKILKKLGKRYSGLRIYNESAGQRAFKVRAVRKVKKKTYKGSFSAVKSTFIKSPLTLEQLSRIEGDPNEYTEKLDNNGSTCYFKVTGNNVAVSYKFVGDASKKPDANSFFDAIKSDMLSICRDARLQSGIIGVKVNVSLFYNGENLGSRAYSE